MSWDEICYINSTPPVVCELETFYSSSLSLFPLEDTVTLLFSTNQSISAADADRRFAVIAPFSSLSALTWIFLLNVGAIKNFPGL